MSLWTVGHLFYAMRQKVLAEAAALTCSVLHEVSRLRPLDCRFQDPAPASINPSFDLNMVNRASSINPTASAACTQCLVMQGSLLLVSVSLVCKTCRDHTSILILHPHLQWLPRMLQVPIPVPRVAETILLVQHHAGIRQENTGELLALANFNTITAATARRCHLPRIRSPSTLRANTSTPQLKYPECVRHAAEQFKKRVGYPFTGRSAGLPHGRTPNPAVYLQQLQHADNADQQLC
jgi:hypothetical protein